MPSPSRELFGPRLPHVGSSKGRVLETRFGRTRAAERIWEVPVSRQESSAADLWNSSVGTVEDCIRYVACRHRLCGDDLSDFRSEVLLRLVQHDGRILRSHRQRSSLSTFLIATISNLAHDYKRRRSGRWKPSEAARRIGVLGVELEELVYRDKAALAEAVATLQSRYGTRYSRAQIERAYEYLPRRRPRRVHSAEPLAALAGSNRADERIENRRRAEISSRVAEMINSRLDAMDSEDRRILRMRFVDGLTIASIARILRIDQRRLYRRVTRCLRALRTAFKETGIAHEDVTALIGWPESELTFAALARPPQISGGSSHQLRAS